MNYRSLAIAASVFCTGLAHSAPPIDFEDIISPGCCSFPAPGYQGFEWGGGSGEASWVIGEESADVFEGMEAYSGSNYAWSNGAAALSLVASNGGTFDLTGFWARSGNVDFTTTARGFIGGVETYTQLFDVTQSYSSITLNFTGIDRFEIDAQPRNLLLDNIQIGAIPEPETYAMLALGLVGVGAMVRRRGR